MIYKEILSFFLVMQLFIQINGFLIRYEKGQNQSDKMLNEQLHFIEETYSKVYENYQNYYNLTTSFGLNDTIKATSCLRTTKLDTLIKIENLSTIYNECMVNKKQDWENYLDSILVDYEKKTLYKHCFNTTLMKTILNCINDAAFSSKNTKIITSYLISIDVFNTNSDVYLAEFYECRNTLIGAIDSTLTHTVMKFNECNQKGVLIYGTTKKMIYKKPMIKPTTIDVYECQKGMIESVKMLTWNNLIKISNIKASSYSVEIPKDRNNKMNNQCCKNNARFQMNIAEQKAIIDNSNTLTEMSYGMEKNVNVILQKNDFTKIFKLCYDDSQSPAILKCIDYSKSSKNQTINSKYKKIFNELNNNFDLIKKTLHGNLSKILNDFIQYVNLITNRYNDCIKKENSSTDCTSPVPYHNIKQQSNIKLDNEFVILIDEIINTAVADNCNNIGFD